ncbi:hypothetical protein IMZ48_37830 [Candidatus Bathyarchaeota archaeon]|nr:hypothetical protein [Candidatus Bathyarchaeota archaeon]
MPNIIDHHLTLSLRVSSRPFLPFLPCREGPTVLRILDRPLAPPPATTTARPATITTTAPDGDETNEE